MIQSLDCFYSMYYAGECKAKYIKKKGREIIELLNC